MKIRTGFVSNSSSSSFCLYGCTFNTTSITKSMLTDEAIKLLEEKEFVLEDPNDEDSSYYDSYEVLAALGGGQMCGEEDYFVAGEAPWEMKADETRSQFEERVRNQVRMYFKDADKFEQYKNVLGTVVALGVMLFTNFLIDAPLTRYLTNMFVDKEEIKHIAKLSKIKLSDEELCQISKQVEQILEYVDQLNEINDDIEPLENISGNYNRLRDDVIIDFNNKEQILKNAPKTKDGFILVPKVLDN